MLGRGRRARGVTVTKSGQEELMVNVSIVLLSFASSDVWSALS